MAAKKSASKESAWRERLYEYGFDDNDIDAIYASPEHIFLIKMNATFGDALKNDILQLLSGQNTAFHDKMIADVRQVIETELRPIKSDLADLRVEVNVINGKFESHEIRIKNLEKNFRIILNEHCQNHGNKSIAI